MLVTRYAEITGLSVGEIRRHRGRITAEVFAKRLLEDDGRVAGIYDASVSVRDPNPFGYGYPARDPSLDPLIAPVVSSFNAYVRDELNYKTDLRYELMNPDVARAWNWAEAGLGDLPGVGTRLRAALSLNPTLKVLVTHGYFDLATPYFASKYVVERLELGEDIFPNLRLAGLSGRPHVLHASGCSPAVLPRRQGAVRDVHGSATTALTEISATVTPEKGVPSASPNPSHLNRRCGRLQNSVHSAHAAPPVV